MSTMSDVRKSLGLLGAVVRAMAWFAVTIWLGLIGIFGAGRFVLRLQYAFATSLRCPRGHRVELYGTFRCSRCKAVREGRGFDACFVCGARPTHIDCDRCGLSVKDPLP